MEVQAATVLQHSLSPRIHPQIMIATNTHMHTHSPYLQGVPVRVSLDEGGLYLSESMMDRVCILKTHNLDT